MLSNTSVEMIIIIIEIVIHLKMSQKLFNYLYKIFKNKELQNRDYINKIKLLKMINTMR